MTEYFYSAQHIGSLLAAELTERVMRDNDILSIDI